MAKTIMGFSSGLLGVILGFYFNRERLTKESRERENFSSQALDLEAVTREIEIHRATLDKFDKLIKEIAEEE